MAPRIPQELAAGPVPERPMRAYIYNRNSRGKDSRSTDDTNLENHRLCEARGWSVAGVFFDRGISASRHATAPRDDWAAMTAGVRAGGCDVIVLWESSRGYRNTRTYLDLRDLCEETGVLLCYNGRVYDMRNRSDRFVTHFDAMRNEDEVDGIKERNLRTVRINAERGRPHGKVPYGFQREYDARTGALLRQYGEPEEAAVLNEAARRVAAGKTLRSICADFRKREIPGEWNETTLRQLLLRPTNIGKRVFRGVIVGAASWDAVMDEELYYAVVSVLKKPERRTQHDNAVKHLMAGLASCGACGRDEEPAAHVLKSTARGAYACRCFRVSIKMEWLDAVVTTALLEHVSNPEFAAGLRATGSGGMSAALAEASAMEAQLGEARELAKTFKDGRFMLSVVSLAGMEAELLPRIEAARARALDATVPEVVRRLASAGDDAWEMWHDELDLAQKRTAIRGLVKVTVYPPGRGVKKPRPEWFGWDWLR